MGAPAYLLKRPDGQERPMSLITADNYGYLNPKNPIFGTPGAFYHGWEPDSFRVGGPDSAIQATNGGVFGTWRDVSGNGLHATSVNSPTMQLAQGESTDLNGFCPAAAKFVRASSQYCTLPSVPQSNCGAIILAVKNLGFSGSQAMVGGPGGSSFTTRFNADGRITVDDSATVNLLTTTSDEIINAWTVIAWTGDPTGSYYRLWVDGMLMKDGNALGALFVSGTQTFLAAEPGPANYFNGLIMAARFYTGLPWNNRLARWQTWDFWRNMRMDGF